MISVEKARRLSAMAHNDARDKGFWDVELPQRALFTLVITEMSEAVEADRKGRRADLDKFEAVFYSEESLEEKKVAFLDCVKDTIEDELADAYIRLLDISGHERISPLDGYGEFGDHYGEYLDMTYGMPFPELIYMAIGGIFLANSIEEAIGSPMLWIMCICAERGIDLEKHIEYKMWYNTQRERKNGKNY